MTTEPEENENNPDSNGKLPKGVATQLLIQLSEGDETAAEPLFDEYRPMLERIARARIRSTGLRGKDEFDAAQSVLWLYLRAVRNGQMNEVENSQSFENVLLKMLSNKLNDYFKYEFRQKRGSGNVTNFSTLSSEKVIEFIDERKTEAYLKDLFNGICDSISSDRGKEIASLLMQGHTRKEAAKILGVTERTVYRELHEARLEIEEIKE